MFSAGPAPAQVMAVDMPVAASGKTLEQARELAVAGGRRAAFDKIMRQAAPEGADMAAPDDARLKAMASTHEVVEETFKDGRYSGTVRYQFDPQALAGVSAPVPALGPPSGVAVLVVPVLEADGKLTLWEKENRWRGVWNQVAMVAGRGNIVLPAGDLTDTELLDGAKARGANYGQLLPMLHRYGAKEALLVDGKLSEDESGAPPMLDVKVRLAGPKGTSAVYADRFFAEPGETSDQLMRRAAQGMAETLRKGAGNAPTLQALADDRAEKSLPVTMPLKELAEWPELRRRLTRAMPPITRLELATLSPERVDMVLHFTGGADSLLQSLSAQQLTLAHVGEEWRLGMK